MNDGGLAIATRRMFRQRTVTIPRGSIRGVKWSSGFFMNHLTIRAERDYRFLVFKTPEAEVTQPVLTASAARS